MAKQIVAMNDSGVVVKGTFENGVLTGSLTQRGAGRGRPSILAETITAKPNGKSESSFTAYFAGNRYTLRVPVPRIKRKYVRKVAVEAVG